MIENDGNNIWVADTGATCHMGCVKLGMIDIKPSLNNIKVGNGDKLGGNAIGDLNVIYLDKISNMKHRIRLIRYIHNPKLKYNLFSIPYAMNHGAHVRIENGFLKVESKGCVVKFDMKLKSGSSYLMCARMMPMTDSYHENAMITQEKNEC